MLITTSNLVPFLITAPTLVLMFFVQQNKCWLFLAHLFQIHCAKRGLQIIVLVTHSFRYLQNGMQGRLLSNIRRTLQDLLPRCLQDGHFWAQCQLLVLNFSVVNGMPISDTIHNQITWNRVQHLAIIKDMWGLTSSRAWGYNNFASVSQLIANYRFATQDESSCPKLSNAVTNAVTASPKAQFSQCKQLALTIHYGKDCYLLSTSLSIFLHSESRALDL